jgi:hypothetical protein
MADTPNPPNQPKPLAALIKHAEDCVLDLADCKADMLTAVHEICVYLSANSLRIPHGLSADLHKNLVKAGAQ